MKREISAGIIVYRKTQEGLKFLILYHGRGYWNLPKGKIETEEKSLEAAIRETREETGLTQRDLKIIKNFKTQQRFYFKKSGQPTFKIVIIYLAETKNRNIKISFEHNGFGWFTYREALKILNRYRESQKVLQQAYKFLSNQGLK